MTWLQTQRDLVTNVLVEHTFDHEAGECMCGQTFTSGWGVAEHVAEELEQVLSPVPVFERRMCDQ